MSATLQREHWNGQPTYLGDLFRVSKMRGEKQLSGRLPTLDASSGMGGTLDVNGDLQRSEVFRSQDEVLTAGETWKAAMSREGVAVT